MRSGGKHGEMIVFTLLVLVLSPRGPAATLTVDDDAPAEFSTIQAAIDAAADGDTIVVQPGAYTGPGNRDIDFGGKAITVRSAAGPKTCIVVCEGTMDAPHAGFILRRPGQGTALVEGLTITGGYSKARGGGIQMEGRCVVKNCVIVNNFAEQGGGGVFMSGGGMIVNCVIANNLTGSETLEAWGGGILADRGQWQIIDPLIINCTVVGNKATGSGGGIACGYDGTAAMENCIIVGNLAGTANQVWAYDRGTILVAMRLNARNCCIQNDSCADIWQSSCPQPGIVRSVLTAEDVLHVADPGFVDPLHGDFRLRPDSPCVDRGLIATSAGLPDTDIAGNARMTDGDRDGVARPDIGAYELPVTDEAHLWVSALSLRFTPSADGLAPEPQTLTLQNLGTQVSDWKAHSECNWLTLTPDAGRLDQGQTQIVVSVDPVGLDPGTRTCNITISDESASNSPVTIPVTLSTRFRRVPDEYPTIQQAIDAADPYDTILVGDGIYSGLGNESIACRGKPLTLRSENGPENCTIQRLGEGSGNSLAFVFDHRDHSCIVDGFTIAGCSWAVYCEGGSHLVIRNCHIAGRKGDGGTTFYLADAILEDCTLKDCGLSSRWSSIHLRRCAFRDNKTAVSCYHACALHLQDCDVRASRDGAIYVSDCSELQMANCSVRGTKRDKHALAAVHCLNTMSVLVESSVISDNRLPGLLLSSCPDVTVRNTIVSGSCGYGIGHSRGNLSIENCTLVGNGGAGLSYYGPHGRVTNGIFWANGANQIAGDTASLDVRYCSVQAGWAGVGNIDKDPLFADPGHWDANGTSDDPNDDFWIDGDYHLRSQTGRWDSGSQVWVADDVTSPCVDVGDPNDSVGDEPEPNGGRINMGAYGGMPEASKSYVEGTK